MLLVIVTYVQLGPSLLPVPIPGLLWDVDSDKATFTQMQP